MVETRHSAEYSAFRLTVMAARKGAGLTQAELAAKLGKPQSFVSKYEAGERRLDVVEFLVIAHILGKDPCCLLQEVISNSTTPNS